MLNPGAGAPIETGLSMAMAAGGGRTHRHQLARGHGGGQGNVMERIAVGSRVRIVWPSAHDGLTGVVTSIDGTKNRLYVRIDGERWRTMAPILLARDEVVPAETEGAE